MKGKSTVLFDIRLSPINLVYMRKDIKGTKALHFERGRRVRQLTGSGGGGGKDRLKTY